MLEGLDGAGCEEEDGVVSAGGVGAGVESAGGGVGVAGGVSVVTTDGFWLAWVEKIRGSSDATTISASSAVAAPRPIHNPRRAPAVATGSGAGMATGVNGGGCGGVYCCCGSYAGGWVA